MYMKHRGFVLVALVAVGIDPGARSAEPDPGAPDDSLLKLAADEAELWARRAADLEKQLGQAKSEAATLRTRATALEVDLQRLTEQTADLRTAGIYIYKGPEDRGHPIHAHEFGSGKMDFAFWRRGVEDAEQGRWEIGRRVCNTRFGLVLQGRPTGDPPHQGLLFERVLCVP